MGTMLPAEASAMVTLAYKQGLGLSACPVKAHSEALCCVIVHMSIFRGRLNFVECAQGSMRQSSDSLLSGLHTSRLAKMAPP